MDRLANLLRATSTPAAAAKIAMNVATGNRPEPQALVSPPKSAVRNGRNEKISATPPPAMTTISPGVTF